MIRKFRKQIPMLNYRRLILLSFIALRVGNFLLLDRLPRSKIQSGMGEESRQRNIGVFGPAGLGGKGNEGVAGYVKQTPNSIGYVELIYATQNNMTYGRLQNKAGKICELHVVFRERSRCLGQDAG